MRDFVIFVIITNICKWICKLGVKGKYLLKYYQLLNPGPREKEPTPGIKNLIICGLG